MNEVNGKNLKSIIQFYSNLNTENLVCFKFKTFFNFYALVTKAKLNNYWAFLLKLPTMLCPPRIATNAATIGVEDMMAVHETNE